MQFSILSIGESLIGFISQPWHWAVSGMMLALVLFLMTWLGRQFGVSSSFKALCAAGGAGRKIPFFNIDLKAEYWRLAFVLGAILGGILSFQFLASPETVDISVSTQDFLSGLGLSYPEIDATGRGFLPTEIFHFGSLKGVILALLGGFLIGFGARYARGMYLWPRDYRTCPFTIAISADCHRFFLLAEY